MVFCVDEGCVEYLICMGYVVVVSVCGGDGGVSGDCVCMCVRGGKFKFVCA